MSEKKILVNGLQFEYKGVFDFAELLNVIYRSIEERGYIKQEKKHEEYVRPEGKEIFLELRPNKKKTEYFSLMIKIRITMKKVKEITLEIDGVPRLLNQAEINIRFDCWTTTDYEGRWMNKPWYYFFRALIDKYVYKFPMDESFFGEGVEDTRHIYEQIRSHLGLYKFKAREAKPVSE